LVQERHRPAAFIQFVGGKLMSRLEAVPALGSLLVQRNDVKFSAALHSLSAIPFIRQEVLERSEQKRAEFPFARIDLAQIVLRQQSGKEFLRQVFGVMG